MSKHLEETPSDFSRFSVIVFVWLIALVMSGYASENATNIGGLLHFSLVGAVWLSGYIWSGNFKKTTGRLIGTFIAAFFSIGIRWQSYGQATHPEAKYIILSDVNQVVDGYKYLLQLETENADKVSINGEIIELMDNQRKIEKEIDLKDLTTDIEINMNNDFWTTGITLKIKRQPTPEETIIEKERIRQEKIATERKVEEELKQDWKSNPEKYIEIIKKDWGLDGFGTIAIHTITVKNKSQIDYKDITFKATYYSDSDTLLDSAKQTIYEVIPAGKTKIFKKVNFGFVNSQATQSVIEVINVVVK